jgi:signal peptidase I
VTRDKLVSALLPAGAVAIAALVVVASGLGLVVVTGDSMRPAIRAGDMAIYMRPQVLDVGDVVVYELGDSTRVIHRVASVEGTDSVRTRGDANSAVDRESLDVGRVRGRIVAVVPSGWMARVDWPARAATLMSQFDTRR